MMNKENRDKKSQCKEGSTPDFYAKPALIG
jgi:hypothetical protein